MKICSLLPGATEVIAALGLIDDLVGISHECDYPPTIIGKPIIVEAMLSSQELGSYEIDKQVNHLMTTNQRLYRLNDHLLRQAQPDLILTQDLCHVCAVTPNQLYAALSSLSPQPTILTLSPHSVYDVIDDVVRIGDATNRSGDGHRLATRLRDRLNTIQRRTHNLSHRPRVACIEWLSPLYAAGHWIPEMVALAGGQDVLAQAGDPSRVITWDEIVAADPNVLILMPCGFSVIRTQAELSQLTKNPGQWALPANLAPYTFLVDAASYFSRPGPRLLDGIELLAAILHPSDEYVFCTTIVSRLQP